MAPFTPFVAYAKLSQGTRTSPSSPRRGAIGKQARMTALPVSRTHNSHSRSSSSLHVKYQRLIPPIDVRAFCSRGTPPAPPMSAALTRSQIEILPAGEEGPRRLDGSTVMTMNRVPFLTVTEFIRAKVKAWSMWVLSSYSICFAHVFIQNSSTNISEKRQCT